MLAGLHILARAVGTDIARLRQRMATTAICYAIAVVAFAAAFGLGVAAAVIILVEIYGAAGGLVSAAVILLLAGVAALAVNAVLRVRQQRLKQRATALRTAAIAQTATTGAARAREATPALLPVAAILAFAFASSLLKPTDRDR
ncbi:hypothetical protein [Oricola thermophila]|uniref:Uncharacterized protein n=1 Tax=Oricola thermophila TaxID=2742145 RepID=A0A6N1VDR2_9HYPH|nr:hypothetical protein [Oricola thermophila]QKV19036.1 hypothetical protein HTY61_11530 [Oricola thermophila]